MADPWIRRTVAGIVEDQDIVGPDVAQRVEIADQPTRRDLILGNRLNLHGPAVRGDHLQEKLDPRGVLIQPPEPASRVQRQERTDTNGQRFLRGQLTSIYS